MTTTTSPSDFPIMDNKLQAFFYELHLEVPLQTLEEIWKRANDKWVDPVKQFNPSILTLAKEMIEDLQDDGSSS